MLGKRSDRVPLFRRPVLPLSVVDALERRLKLIADLDQERLDLIRRRVFLAERGGDRKNRCQ